MAWYDEMILRTLGLGLGNEQRFANSIWDCLFGISTFFVVPSRRMLLVTVLTAD